MKDSNMVINADQLAEQEDEIAQASNTSADGKK
jgi:hypothetical protein